MILENAVQLSPSVFLYKPTSETDKRIAQGPRLIILATWAFAQNGHIAKYVKRYQEMYPEASILVLRSFLRHFFWIPAAKKELVPAVSVIRNGLGVEEGPADAQSEHSKPPLLLHVFSNSGLATAYNLSDVYAASSTCDDKRLPLHAAVFDSTPGHYEYWSVASAVMYGVPRGFSLQRMVALPLAHFLSAFLWVWVHIFQGQDWVGVYARASNDHGRILETSRSYIYSSADPLVQARKVEAHAEDARSQGFSVVHLADFHDSAHVAHSRADPLRYWGIVKKTWEGSAQAV